jgi:hypothetical protein
MGNLCCRDRKLEEISTITIRQPDTIKINYEHLLVIRLIHHNHTKIYLLEENIVKKQFSLPRDREQFLNEVETYRKLANLPFILKPLYIDMKKGVIYLPFIDAQPVKNSKNKNTVSAFLSIIKNKYGIWRESEYIWTNLLQSSKTGQIYLIDFGNIPWHSSVPNSKWHIAIDKYPRPNLEDV